MAAPKDADVRSVIRSILVSTPNQMTARILDRDFIEMEGFPIPYKKFGFRSLLDYLKSIPDTVTIKDSSSNPVVLPVASERSSHVEKLVLKQRIQPSKRGGFHQRSSRRSLNHVSQNSNKNRSRSRGKSLVSHMPESRPLANVRVDRSLPGSSNDCTNNFKDPFQNRPRIDAKCLQQQVIDFQKQNNAYTLQPQCVPNSQKQVANKGDASYVPRKTGPPQLSHERVQPINSTPRIPSIFELKFDQKEMENLRGVPAFYGGSNLSHIQHHPVLNYRPEQNAYNFRNTIPAFPFANNANSYGQPVFQTHSPILAFQAPRSARRSSNFKSPLLEDPVPGKGPQSFKGNSDCRSPLLKDPVVGKGPQLFKANDPVWNTSKISSDKPLASPVVPPPAQQKPPTANTNHRDTSVNSNATSWLKKSNTNILPAGAEQSCKSPDRLSCGSKGDDGSFSADKNKNNDNSWMKKSSANIFPAGAETTFQNSSGRLSSGSRSNDGSFISDNENSLISNRMKDNFKTLLRRNPEGIFCSELPALYEAEFNATLCCQDFGYNSIIQMVSEHPNIFSFTRFDKTGDWLLKTPSGHIQDKSDDSLPPKRWVPKKIIQNILKILGHFPAGLPLSQFLQKYEEFVNESFDFRQYGNTIEAVMMDLENYVHQRRIGSDILLYEASKYNNTVIEKQTFAVSPALPDSIQMNLLHKDLYPEECCGLGDVIPPQALPKLGEKRFIEVRVSDFENPGKMWFHLGECYDALQKMMEDLHQFYSVFGSSKYDMPELTIRPGQLCACIFQDLSEGQAIQKWHRAIILSYTKDVKVQIEYIDYGTKGSVDRSILRFLHKDFTKLRTQAIRGKLLSVHPPIGCNDWPKATNQYLLELTKDKRLMLELVIVNTKEHSIAGILYDTNEADDLVINDELVSSGHAVYTADLENNKKPESPVSEQYAPHFSSPISRVKSDQTLPWNSSRNFEDSQMSSRLPSKYYESNAKATHMDSSSGFHTSSKLTTDIPSSSPPFTYTTGFNGSLSPHSRNPSMSPHSVNPSMSPHSVNPSMSPHSVNPSMSPHSVNPSMSPHSVNPSMSPHSVNPSMSPHSLNPSMSPHSRHSSNSPDIIYYGSGDHLNKVPSSTPPLSNNLSKYSFPELSRPQSCSPHSCRFSSPLSPSPKSEFVGDQYQIPSIDMNKPVPNTIEYYNPPLSATTTTTVTTVPTASISSSKRPPPGFGNEEQQKPVSILPYLNNANCDGLGQLTAVNQAPQIMTQPLLPNYSPYLWPTIPAYLGMGLQAVYPMFNNGLLNQLPTISFPNRNQNTFMANSLYSQEAERRNTMLAAGLPPPTFSNSGLNTPVTNTLYTQAPNVQNQMPSEQESKMFAAGLPPPSFSNSGINTPVTNTLYTQAPNVQNQIPSGGFPPDSSRNCGYCTDETSHPKPVSGYVDASKTDLPTSLPTPNTKPPSVDAEFVSSLLNSDQVAAGIDLSGSHTPSNLNNSSGSVETVTATSDTCKNENTEATSPTCGDTDSVCSDWEAYETANETVRCVSNSKEYDSESVCSDVETDAFVKKTVRSPSTSSVQSDCPRPTALSAKNLLANRASKPMSRSAKKRQRRALAKNKDKETTAAYLPVIDSNTSLSNDTASPTENDVASDSSGFMKDSGKDIEDSVAISNSKGKVTSKNTKSKKKQVKIGKVQEIGINLTRLASLDTSIRRPKNRDILLEIPEKDSNSNELVEPDQIPVDDGVKNDDGSRAMSEDSKSNVKVSKSDKKNSKGTDGEVSSNDISSKSNPNLTSNPDTDTNDAKHSTKSDNKHKPSSKCDSLPKEKSTDSIKRKLVQDWKLLDNISKDSIYEPKPVEGNSSESKEENRESSCDMIDRIISSLGRANVYGKAEEEISHSTPKESVQQKVINSKTIHIFVHNKQPTVCTDEIITSFTKFTKRLAVNKALDCMQAVKPYFDISRKSNAQLFKLLDNCKISGITKEGDTQLPDKLSIIPLETVSNLLKNLGAVPSIVDSFSNLFEELNDL